MLKMEKDAIVEEAYHNRKRYYTWNVQHVNLTPRIDLMKGHVLQGLALTDLAE